MRAWILSFGAGARVVSPVGLAQEIFETALAMRRRYARTHQAYGRAEMLSMRVS